MHSREAHQAAITVEAPDRNANGIVSSPQRLVRPHHSPVRPVQVLICSLMFLCFCLYSYLPALAGPQTYIALPSWHGGSQPTLPQ